MQYNLQIGKISTYSAQNTTTSSLPSLYRQPKLAKILNAKKTVKVS